MDENPYLAPQVERSESDELTSGDGFAEKLKWPDKRVLAVACLLIALAMGGQLVIAFFLPSVKW